MKKSWDRGEIIAIEYLQRKWYRVRAVNFKFSTIWEIDVVADFWEKVVFIEVKYRKTSLYWSGEEAISKTKLKKIHKTIMYYCEVNNVDVDDAQFDVISIKEEEGKIYHYKNQALV